MLSKWEVRPSNEKHVGNEVRIGQTTYQVYRVEIGAELDEREEAEHLAYELNKEASGGLN